VITRIVPATYYIDILSGIYLRDLGFAYLWPDLAILTGMFLVLTIANCIVLKREGL
jgi:ABC-2 type transport system permease protein